MKDEETLALNDLRSVSLSYVGLLCHDNAVDLERKDKYTIKIDNEYETIKSALIEKDKLEQENRRLKARINSVYGSMCADGKSTETLKCNTPRFIEIRGNRINPEKINYYYTEYCLNGHEALYISFGIDDRIRLETKDKDEFTRWLKLLGE